MPRAREMGAQDQISFAKRNTTSYDLAGGVSPTELAQVMKDLVALREQVEAWLKETHPELIHDDSHQS